MKIIHQDKTEFTLQSDHGEIYLDVLWNDHVSVFANGIDYKGKSLDFAVTLDSLGQQTTNCEGEYASVWSNGKEKSIFDVSTALAEFILKLARDARKEVTPELVHTVSTKSRKEFLSNEVLKYKKHLNELQEEYDSLK
jgi:hypothetical protein